jgi:hypothetical protein
MRYDIIPDIHGQSGKLRQRLSKLGYRLEGQVWRPPDRAQQCVFLGDFIDRGADNSGVIDIVRRMIDAGTAVAVMGNHELNAIHFHSTDPETGTPLRSHSQKNINQHRTFLAEFPPGDPRTMAVVDWMKTLPLFLEFPGFRVVHACWNEAAISRLKAQSPQGRLTADQFVLAGRRDDPLCEIVDTVTKGPEVPLPDGTAFTDKDGTRRTSVRLQWWRNNARTWADLAISVPDPAQLPQSSIPDEVMVSMYPSDAKPVLFGHYWRSGTPHLQAPNALCLDYSAGTDGPLVSYALDGDEHRLSLGNLSGF